MIGPFIYPDGLAFSGYVHNGISSVKLLGLTQFSFAKSSGGVESGHDPSGLFFATRLFGNRVELFDTTIMAVLVTSTASSAGG